MRELDFLAGARALKSQVSSRATHQVATCAAYEFKSSPLQKTKREVRMFVVRSDSSQSEILHTHSKSMCIAMGELSADANDMAAGERCANEIKNNTAAPPSTSSSILSSSPSSQCRHEVIHRTQGFHRHSYLIAELINIGSVCFDSGQYQLGARCFGDALRATRRAHRQLVDTDDAGGKVSLSETVLAVDSAHQALSTFTITYSATNHKGYKCMHVNNTAALSVFAKPMPFEQESDILDSSSSLAMLSETLMPRMLAVILFNLGLCHHICGTQTNNRRCYVKAREAYKLALKQLRDECTTMKASGTTLSSSINAEFVMRHMAILNNLGCVLQSLERREDNGAILRRKYTSCFRTIGRLVSFFDNDGSGFGNQERALFELNILLASSAPSPAA